ncbi:disease resistance protein TAO1-like [Cryptomeria japonica]|uniref:disease resistance protein TAO1-like n=1 Tax=Cryptomeria japonica TaxID=3369 RepID=UPI0025ABFAD6|nr:disease resistance protein TAO1-like [Cryptomeria japonica]
MVKVQPPSASILSLGSLLSAKVKFFLSESKLHVWRCGKAYPPGSLVTVVTLFLVESISTRIIVGEEEFRALEDASFVKTSGSGFVIVHDIVRARGGKMSDQEGNRITEPETLSECLKNEEKLKKLKGVLFNEEYGQPPIEITETHLNCMSDSLKLLAFKGSQIIFRQKCHKPFKQLRYLGIPSDVTDLPMEFAKLGRLTKYRGPLTQGMSMYELPPSLCSMHIIGSYENEVAYSKAPPRAAPASSLVKLFLYDMQRLPHGLEKLTKLQKLYLVQCKQLREIPSTLLNFNNLQVLRISECHELRELPSDFGQQGNLISLDLSGCSKLGVLPSSFEDLISLKKLKLKRCSSLQSLPSNFGQLKILEELNLGCCSKLEEWPTSFGDLQKMKKLVLVGCSSKLKETVPHNIRQNCSIIFD